MLEVENCEDCGAATHRHVGPEVYELSLSAASKLSPFKMCEVHACPEPEPVPGSLAADILQLRKAFEALRDEVLKAVDSLMPKQREATCRNCGDLLLYYSGWSHHQGECDDGADPILDGDGEGKA